MFILFDTDVRVFIFCSDRVNYYVCQSVKCILHKSVYSVTWCHSICL